MNAWLGEDEEVVSQVYGYDRSFGVVERGDGAGDADSGVC